MVKTFKNKKTDEIIRWDPAIFRNENELLPGRAGVNHWHRYNPDPNSDLSYIDKDSKPCSMFDEQSAIIPHDQVKLDQSIRSIENEDRLNNETMRLVKFLDQHTDSWLHDSVIEEINIEENLFLKIRHKNNDQLISTAFIFKDYKFLSETTAHKIQNKEIFLFKIALCDECENSVIVFLSDGQKFEIRYNSLLIENL